MTLSEIKNLKEERGFTIVELLIVIVVIAILAAIVIVSFNGVQNNAKTQSSKASAASVQKKIEAFNAQTGNYPVATTYANFLTELNGQTSSTILGSGITLGTPVNTSTTTVGIYRCSTATTAMSVTWYDYLGGAIVAAADGLKINFNGTCGGTWTQLT